MKQKVIKSLNETLKLFRLVVSQANVNRSLPVAATLSLTTLLAMVPMLAVVFAIVSAFPAFAGVEHELQNLLLQHFLPSTGANLQNYLTTFVGSAQKLTSFGIVFLLVTAIGLLWTIEKAFNNIWKPAKERSKLQALMVYWAVLTVTPILMAGSIIVSTYLESLPYLSNVIDDYDQFTSIITPLCLSTFALFWLYIILPHTKVGWLSAALSALLAAIVLELLKNGFAFYTTQIADYHAIYGAVAILPLLIIWLYLCWYVVLIGAEFCYAFDNRQELLSEPGLGNRFLIAIALLQWLVKHFQKGEQAKLKEIVSLTDNSREQIIDVIALLHNIHLVERYEDNVILLRDLTTVKLKQLCQLFTIHELQEASELMDKQAGELQHVLQNLFEVSEQVLDDSLSQYLN